MGSAANSKFSDPVVEVEIKRMRPARFNQYSNRAKKFGLKRAHRFANGIVGARRHMLAIRMRNIQNDTHIQMSTNIALYEHRCHSFEQLDLVSA